MFWQKLISNQKLNFQEKKWILSGLTFFNDNNGKRFIPHVVFDTPVLSCILKKRFKLLVQLGEVELQGFISLVSSVLSGAFLLFHVRNLSANSIRMIFWYIILMRHCCPFDVHQTWTWPSYLVFLGSSAPLYPPPPPNVCKRRVLHGTIGFEVSQGGYSSVRELVRILNAPNLRFQSPGWFFTFSFPWRFKLTTLAFSISRMIFWTLGR